MTKNNMLNLIKNIKNKNLQKENVARIKEMRELHENLLSSFTPFSS
jgi:hypothetical protein